MPNNPSSGWRVIQPESTGAGRPMGTDPSSMSDSAIVHPSSGPAYRFPPDIKAVGISRRFCHEEPTGRSGSKALDETPFASPKDAWYSSVGNPKEDVMKQKADVQQGTLALMVLKTLDLLGPLHGYGIARRIARISGDLLAVNQGTLYPVLQLEQEGAIESEWGASENNCRARFYRLTRDGRRQLQVETKEWLQATAIIARFFKVRAENLS
jgi:PadR family transcriptional regulator, regulatory protein PadR